MRHADLTRCAGESCAWKNDGGHVLAHPLADVLLANMHDGQEGGTLTMSVNDLVRETVEVITDYLVDDEFLGYLQNVVIDAQGDSNDQHIESLEFALSDLTSKLHVTWPDRDQIDDSSSASRQHRIDTGRYLAVGEAWDA